MIVFLPVVRIVENPSVEWIVDVCDLRDCELFTAKVGVNETISIPTIINPSFILDQFPMKFAVLVGGDLEIPNTKVCVIKNERIYDGDQDLGQIFSEHYSWNSDCDWNFYNYRAAMTKSQRCIELVGPLTRKVLLIK